MNLIERVEHIRQVWRMVCPHLPEPSPQDISRWLGNADRIIERAIVRTSEKFAPSRIDATFDYIGAFRYTTATARLMSIAEELENRAASMQS